jgi:hypothetical protein
MHAFMTKFCGGPNLSGSGLGRVKTQGPAARTECFGEIAHHQSQIMLHT